MTNSFVVCQRNDWLTPTKPTRQNHQPARLSCTYCMSASVVSGCASQDALAHRHGHSSSKLTQTHHHPTCTAAGHPRWLRNVRPLLDLCVCGARPTAAFSSPHGLSRKAADHPVPAPPLSLSATPIEDFAPQESRTPRSAGLESCAVQRSARGPQAAGNALGGCVYVHVDVCMYGMFFFTLSIFLTV